MTFPLKSILSEIKIRHIRKIFGFKNGDTVILVCSELPKPMARQMVEKREFIYLMKYGDIDAWVEYLLSMMRTFPKVNFIVQSSGEALTNKLNLDTHIALIGGPDYNKLTEYFINKKMTRFSYTEIDGEIVLVDGVTGKNYFYTTIDKDYGYIEKFPNPHNRNMSVFIFGGCHTVGVTSAVKFFSSFSNGNSKVSSVALKNAEKFIKNKKIDIGKFALLINAAKIGSTISYPCYENDLVEIDNKRIGDSDLQP
jgi:hypothetical protein